MSDDYVAPSADKMGAVQLQPEVFKAFITNMTDAAKSDDRRPSNFRCPKCTIFLHYPNHRALSQREDGKFYKHIKCDGCDFTDWQEWK